MTASVLRRVVETHRPEETEALGRRLGARLRPGDVVALIGPLGAGKTVITRGIVDGAGAGGHVASPSFVIIREYDGPVRVFHADFYRLDRIEEIADLGLDDLFEAGGIVVIEWADRAAGLLPGTHVRIDIDFGETEEDRVVVLTVPAALSDRLDDRACGAPQ